MGLRVFLQVSKDAFQPHPAFMKQLKVPMRPYFTYAPITII